MINLSSIHALIFDFDGVLTDNYVYVDESGKESVRCSRSDGLAFDLIRHKKVRAYIVSTEKNKVIEKRAIKLKIPSIQGVSDKKSCIEQLALENHLDLENLVYIGNDINDYAAMSLCGYTVCPSDSHPEILKLADYVLKAKGGHGVVREFVEEVLGINILNELYKK